MRIGYALLLIALAPISSYASGTGERNAAGGKAPVIAYVPAVKNPFYKLMEKGIRAQAKTLGLKIIVAEYPETLDPELQITILQATFRKGGIDGLLIAPASTEALKAPLRALYDQGVDIVTLNTYIGDGDYSKSGTDYGFPLAHVRSDDESGGRQTAQRLARVLGGSGKVFCEASSADDPRIAARVAGYTKGIAEYPGITLVDVAWCGEIEYKAEQQVRAAIRKDPDIVGIFCPDEYSARGTIRAVVASGLTGAVKICLWDADAENIGFLKKGNADLVLAQKPAEMGAAGLAALYDRKVKNAAVSKIIATAFEFITIDTVNDRATRPLMY
jgi:ribose transport system substrate-binding protein